MATEIAVTGTQTLNILNGIAIQTASVVVGPSATNVMEVTATEIWTWGAPAEVDVIGVQNVWLQARQSSDDNQDNGFADEFALQYIMWRNTGANNLQVTFRITRIDILLNHTAPVPEIGWGQNLQVDIMLITQPQVILE
jgi:hypothetical protein